MMGAAEPRLGRRMLLLAGALPVHSVQARLPRPLPHAPVEFITRTGVPAVRGALRMGIEHGFQCLGCCWALMLLLFVGGVMNLWVIAAITLFVLLEKAAPLGVQGGRLSGALLVLGGLWVLLA